MLAYPGLWAVWSHRVAHATWRRNHRLGARVLATLTRVVTGVDIHPAAQLGPGLFIDHGAGVVIGETAACGAEVTIYQGATLGGTSTRRGKRHPTLGDRVVVGAGAKVLGAVTLGNDVRVGANAVVVDDVPAGAVVVGVPGKAVTTHASGSPAPADTQTDSAVDLVDARLAALDARLGAVEHAVTGAAVVAGPQLTNGVWATDDFVI